MQTPAMHVGHRWWNNTEFDHSMTLWQEIEAKCHEARRIYEGSSGDNLTSEDISQEAIAHNLDKAWEELGAAA